MATAQVRWLDRHPVLSRHRHRVLGSFTWLLALLSGAGEVVLALRHRTVGLDLLPLYHAAGAVRHGTSVYAVRAFVYPPTAAVAGVPLTVLRSSTVVFLYLCAEVAILAAVAAAITFWLAGVSYPRGWWITVSGLAATALIWSHPAAHSLWLANLSVAIAGIGVIVVWLFGGGRWRAGCLLLVASLLLKPLLLPLILVPLIARRWRPLLIAAAAGGVLLTLCVLGTTGFSQIPHVIDGLLHGSVLVGRLAPNNISISGFSEVHQLPRVVNLGSRLVICLAAGAACLPFVRRPELLTDQRIGDVRLTQSRVRLARIACLSALLIDVVLLAGSLSEVHYVFAIIPGGCLALLLSRRPAVRMAVGVAVAMTLYPARHLSGVTHQGLLLATELAFGVAVFLALHDSARSDQAVDRALKGAAPSLTAS